MATARFRGLDKVGIITDVPRQDLPINAWTDALNIRFDTGKISKVGAWDIVSKSSCLGDQIPLSVVKAPLAEGKYYYASNSQLYAITPNPDYDPSNPDDSPDIRWNITPRDTAGTAVPTYDVNTTTTPAGTKVKHYDVQPAVRWNNTMVADRLVFNSPSYPPIQQQDGMNGNDPLIELKGWGKPDKNDATDARVWRCKKMHAYSDHLLALNMDESAKGSTATSNYPNRIRWSTYAFEGQTPNDWFENDPNGDGGFVDLMEADSAIIDGAPLRNYFMVYTATETYTFNYVGGNDVFQNTKLFSDSGILAEGCVAEIDGQHVVVTADDVIIHDGSQKQSLIAGKIRDRLLSEISSVNSRATRVFTNPVRREVWICYPWDVNGNFQPTEYRLNRAAVFNFQTATWSFCDLPYVYDMAMGEITNALPQASWENGSSYQPTDVEWDVSVTPWELNTITMGNNRLFAASSEHCLYAIDIGDTKWKPVFDPTDPTKFTRTDTGYLTRFVERRGIDMDEVVEEIGRVKTWRTIWPVMGGNGEFIWTIGGRTIPYGNNTLRKPTTFEVGKHYKIDLLFSKRYIDVHIETNTDCEWEFTSYDVDYVVEGRR